MRSTILGQGRHQLGLPGLVPVRHFVAVAQRGFFARLFGFGRRPGRHHLPVSTDEIIERSTPTLQAAAA